MSSELGSTPQPPQIPSIMGSSVQPVAIDSSSTQAAQAVVETTTAIHTKRPNSQTAITRWVQGVPRNKKASSRNRGSHGNVEGEDDDEDDDEHEIDDQSDDQSELSLHESDYDSDLDSVQRDEKRFERKNRLFKVDSDGDLVWYHRESSYTFAEFCRRGIRSLSFMYDRASVSELRKYVLARGLLDPHPQGLTLKYFYLRVLDRADASKTFRFLDLPAEMRNLVYAELLTFGSCPSCPAVHTFCKTAIMRASKQVYKESKEVLYGQNTIKCLFAVSTNEDYIEDRYALIHTTSQVDPDEGGFGTLFEGISLIPEWLHRVQSLRITFDVHGLGAINEARTFLQACVHNLASFLLGNHSLKKLEVNVVNHLHGLGGGPKLTVDLLYPLRRLSGIGHVCITGVADETFSQELAKCMQRAPESVYNTLPHLFHLVKEAEAYVELCEMVNPDDTGEMDEPWGSERPQDQMRLILNDLALEEFEPDLDFGHLMNAESEKETLRKMEDLRCCLAQVSAKDISKKCKEFTSARATRLAFGKPASKGVKNKAPGGK